jgi:hypothetical protein
VCAGKKIAVEAYISKKHLTIPAFLDNTSANTKNSKKSKNPLTFL